MEKCDERTTWRFWWNTLLTLAGVVFILILAWNYSNDLGGQISQFQVRWLLLSTALLLMAQIASACLYATLIERNHFESVSQSRIAGIFLYCQLTKYVPGRIWGIVQQATMIGPSISSGTVVIANIELSVIILAAMTGVGLSAALVVKYGAVAGLIGLVFTWVFAILLYSLPYMRYTLHWIAKLLHLRGLKNGSALASTQRPFAGAFYCFCFIFFYSFGWWLFFWGGTGLESIDSLYLTIALSLSFTIGILSLLPAGIGARDAAMFGIGAWLTNDATLAGSVALTTRLAILAIDFLSFPAGWTIWLYSRRNRTE